MGMKLDSVVPWGRSYEEYVRMFSLSEEDIRRPILGCGDGPASFNSSLTKLGGQVVSCDPIYQFTAQEIKSRIDETYESVIAQMRLNEQGYLWNTIKSIEALGELRMRSMNLFLEDYDAGKADARYLALEFPKKLPFRDNQFELALASHFLLLYSQHLSYDFHLKSINEVMRVAKELRIFPVLTLDGKRSPFLEKLIDYFNGRVFFAELVKVNYEFQIGGNEMLVIRQ